MDERDEEIHTRWCTKQLLIDETNEGLPISDDVQNNCWWMREMKESMPEWRNVNGWDQRRITHARWCTKQMMMDETDERIHIRWCTKQLLMNETNDGLAIPDDVQKNCWWMTQMKESIPDDARFKSGWMRPTKDYPYHIYKTTVHGW